MIGVEGAVQLVAERIADALPGKIEELRDRLGVDAATLPDPQLIVAQETPELRMEQYPAVMIVAQETRSIGRAEINDDGYESFFIRYAVRAYVWARGQQASDTDLVRKRYTLAVRELLLARNLLAPAAAADPTTMVESYSEIGVDEDQRATIAAAFIGFDLVTEETLQPAPDAPDAPLGTVATTVVEIHPALADEEL